MREVTCYKDREYTTYIHTYICNPRMYLERIQQEEQRGQQVSGGVQGSVDDHLVHELAVHQLHQAGSDVRPIRSECYTHTYIHTP